MTMTRPLWLALLTLTGLAAVPSAYAARCLYVSSYHAGYGWNDGIERGMEPVLAGRCELRKFYMDGKRQLGADVAKQKALEARALIESWKPDVIIAADDNASKYLIMPYYRDAAVPVVFCGINWTVEPYGYPYTNATGMIEVGPLEPLVREIETSLKRARRGVFLSADELTQHKEFAMSRREFLKRKIELTHVVARNMADWEAGYLAAQSADFIMLGNNAGISGWNDQRARAFALDHARRLTVSYLDWMAPYSMLTMAKIADEQGEWAAKVAILILDGTAPSRIPIVANRRWDMYVNPPLLAKAGILLAPDVVRQAIKVNP